MARKFFLFVFSATLLISQFSSIFALEKVKLGTATKMSLNYYLPALTAEEKGFWKENGLEVEWVPFGAGAPMMRAVAAGAVSIGVTAAVSPIQVAEKGMPLLIVSELVSSQPWYIYVRTDSPYSVIGDLKNKRVGVSALGGIAHAFARIMVAAHGIEKDVRFIGAGGTVEQLAGFRAGAFEAIISSLGTAVDLKAEGLIRELASVADYLPKPWVDQVVFVPKDLARGKPDVVRKLLKATLQSLDFIRKNPRWALDKMKSFQGLSEEAAKLVYDDTKFTITGKLDRKAMENVRRFFIEYGFITEKAPAVDGLFTNEFLP